MTMQVLKILIPTVITFIIGILSTPFFTKYFYKYKLWKRISRSDKEQNPDIKNISFHKIHNEDAELNTPRVGGVIIWITILLSSILFLILPFIFKVGVVQELNFISRSQTWLPLFALILGSIIGLIDDLLQIFGKRFKENLDGIPRNWRIIIVCLIGLLGALWFYNKLGIASVYIPFIGELFLGVFFIIFFIAVVFVIYSGSVIDGIDGLAGGVMVNSFLGFGIIALLQNQLDIAALSFVIIGAISAFLWFNIPPARFYMGETGMMGLTIALAIIAFLTGHPLLLLIISLPLIITSISSFLQMFWLKVFKKRIFKLAPLHNYFLAIGWSREKVTMRYWVISMFCSVLGIVIFLIG